MPIRDLSRLLVVGLGNYSHPHTRHNVGMMALDYTAAALLGSAPTWRLSKSVGGHVAETVLDESDVQGMPAGWTQHVVFLKPRTFMNLSGGPVARAARELGIRPENIIVFHDDLERKLGAVSMKAKGSASGHNGLKSMIAALRSDVFRRVRIGIDRPVSKDPAAVGDYVLQRFSDAEHAVLLRTGFPAAHEALMRLISDG
ncbi:peptidyl-tRNA hydrolase protein 1 [Geranomyces variabilis]|uniref:Peptidyl-tRNA hydrolase n=1 Tax=Geranomyces variabilis TaxID=109894 RepID=A0AAD5TSU5_9FUNG|nr:peptidyl-tRNA hydrolase protein 1 [Geranomyces variabilis]